MTELIRRSNLLVPITSVRYSPLATWSLDGEIAPPGPPLDDERPNDPWLRLPDAITLDLEDGVAAHRKDEARSLVKDAIGPAGRGVAEVFVRVNKLYLYADIEASVWPGLRGIMLSKAETASDVASASEMLAEMEQVREMEAGSLEIIVLLESALAVWNIREVIAASPRVKQVALGERDLCADLGIVPSREHDPFAYARGRVVVEAIAAGVQPLDIGYPLGSIPGVISWDELLRLAEVGKNLGSKGVICPHLSWVEPVNTAFTPSAKLVDYNTPGAGDICPGNRRGNRRSALRGEDDRRSGG